MELCGFYTHSQMYRWLYWVYIYFNSRMSTFLASQLLVLQRKWSSFGCKSCTTDFQVIVNRATPYFCLFWDYHWWYATMVRGPLMMAMKAEGMWDRRESINLMWPVSQPWLIALSQLYQALLVAFGCVFMCVYGCVFVDKTHSVASQVFIIWKLV